MQSRVLTCATPAYLARHGTPSHPDELLEGHTCIRLLDDVTRKPHNWGFVTRQGERRRIVPDCNLMVNDAPSLMAGIESGYGIGRVLDFIVEQDLQAGRLIEILPEWNWKLWPAYIYTPASSHPSAGLEAFTAFVLSQRFGPESSAR
jgi:DNA-binding transcriptional LysR family regulator